MYANLCRICLCICIHACVLVCMCTLSQSHKHMYSPLCLYVRICIISCMYIYTCTYVPRLVYILKTLHGACTSAACTSAACVVCFQSQCIQVCSSSPSSQCVWQLYNQALFGTICHIALWVPSVLQSWTSVLPTLPRLLLCRTVIVACAVSGSGTWNNSCLMRTARNTGRTRRGACYN